MPKFPPYVWPRKAIGVRATRWKNTLVFLAFAACLLIIALPVYFSSFYPYGFQTSLKGHTDFILSVAFSADGKMIATGSRDATARIWDAATRRERSLLRGHVDDVNSVAFSPDSKSVATASRDGTVKIWDLGSAQVRTTLREHARPSVDGTPLPANCVLFSPDGGILASGGGDYTVRLWDAATARERALLEGHRAAVIGLAASCEGNLLASRSEDGTIKIWDMVAGKELRTLKTEFLGSSLCNAMAVAPGGSTLAANTPSGVTFWDMKTGEVLGVADKIRRVYSIAYSPHGTVLAVNTERTGLTFYDTTTLKKLATWHVGGARPIAFSPDGKTLAAGNYDMLQLWDTGRIAK